MVKKVQKKATNSQEMVQRVQKKATSSQYMVQKVQEVKCGIDKEHQCPLPKKVEVPILDVN